MPNLSSQQLVRYVATTSDTVVYTCPLGTKAEIETLVVANTTAALTKITVSIGGMVIVPNVSVATGSSLVMPLGQIITPGQTLSCWSTVAASCNVFISGRLYAQFE